MSQVKLIFSSLTQTSVIELHCQSGLMSLTLPANMSSDLAGIIGRAGDALLCVNHRWRRIGEPPIRR